MSTFLLYEGRSAVRAELTQRLAVWDAEGGAADGGWVESVGEPDELVAAYRRRPSHIVLIGIQSGTTIAVELTRRMVGSFPGVAVLLLGGLGDTHTAIAALRAGAGGFLRWDALLTTASGAAGTAMLVSPAAAAAPAVVPGGGLGLVEGATGLHLGYPREVRSPRLSEREEQVLLGMSRGLSNLEIARELVLAEDTVKTVARRLFGKLEVSHRAAAVSVGFRYGLLR